MQPVNKVKVTEMNNQPQGRSGSKVPIKTGPAKGVQGNKGKGRSAFTANKGKAA